MSFNFPQYKSGKKPKNRQSKPAGDLPIQPGAKFDIPVDDPYANRILQENIGRLDSNGAKLEVVKIEKIVGQVVGGILNEYIGKFSAGKITSDCLVTIWHQPWIDNPHEANRIKAKCSDMTITQNSEWTRK